MMSAEKQKSVNKHCLLRMIQVGIFVDIVCFAHTAEIGVHVRPLRHFALHSPNFLCTLTIAAPPAFDHIQHLNLESDI